MKKKQRVVCTRCEGVRYAKPPIPTPYVCQRCKHAAVAPRPAPPLPTPKGDPWYSDAARKAEIAADRSPQWIPTRKGWLRS